MLKYPLYDFIATVPTCIETTTLADVLEIFEQEQCNAVAVLDRQQYLLGLLYSARLVPQLLAADRGEGYSDELDLQQPVSTLGQNLIEPIQKLPASFLVEQFSVLLRSQQFQGNTNIEWALIDSNGKFLGIINNLRLLQYIAKQKIDSQKEIQHSSVVNFGQDTKFLTGDRTSISKQKQRGFKQLVTQPLVQLLERLPWPLMLQTSDGEVVTQNPAWWQQLGVLKDPEGVQRQVEAMLANTSSKYSIAAVTVDPLVIGSSQELKDNGNGVSQAMAQTSPSPRTQVVCSSVSDFQQQYAEETTSSNRCFLDSQLGTCTCVVEVQNGQERVWQFAKIPLDSPDMKVLETAPKILLDYRNLEDSANLWLMLATDVTEQQQLCKELAAKNADLIQLNRLKDEFLACISHELKTPLTAVLGLSQLLVDRQLGDLNERQARYAGLIHQSGRHLMSVVNDILDLTRMESGQMELTLSNVNILTVCDRAISEAKAIHAQSNKSSNAQAQGKQLQEHQFTLSIEPGLDRIVADELRLRQMLVHLLSNAFKFTGIEGEIGLWVSRWEGWIAFTVWDTGIGIPEHQQHLIFQKFQQLENPLTRQYEGTGLGLVLTRALARLHGGDVSFLSREGKGSQFTLLLPPSPPAVRTGGEGSQGRMGENSHYVLTSPTPPHPHTNAPKSLILVVEAVARYIEDLTEQLTGLGYRVVIARSGCEAVEKARRLQPKAIFLNPLLPLLSGWDVLTLLKSDLATRHIPVIVTATGAEKEQAFAHRADGFLSVPVQHQVLAPLVESLCVTPEVKKQKTENGEKTANDMPLRILRLVNTESQPLSSHPLLQQHRVIEVDDLHQADLLARVWQFDVVLLDSEMPQAETVLQELKKYRRLATLPLVTCNVATTQAASQMEGLSVFPCLTPLGTDKYHASKKTDTLLSVLQIASGACCPPSISVVDLAILPDLPEMRHQQQRGYQFNSSFNSIMTGDNSLHPLQGLQPPTFYRGSEWFQALIQYLQTAGFKASINRSWAELLQQIRHQSIDLLLICLGESSLQKEVYLALKALEKLPFDLPPILVLDQRLHSSEDSQEVLDKPLENEELVLQALAKKILQRSLSMEELLNEINQVLR
ncbi:MAG: ATP-binding protein [Scytonema sp. PMC 1069.18]|nr:ATP-binding protein [Scytonema sp. PMC 1069.18]MEC4879895.1 ATP-binding protein [Scytonema sp. PMC 1070.18]